MEIVAGEQSLVFQQLFHTNLLILFYYFFRQAFSISGIVKVAAPNFIKRRSRDGLAAKGLLSDDPGKNCTIFYCSAAISFPHIETVVFSDQEFIN